MTHAYPPISDYAIIGNGRTAALVGRDGSIDWCCWPRFDSPAVFCKTVDSRRGGYYRIAPAGEFQARREYFGPTNVLQTTFHTERGTVRLTDLMPAPTPESGDRSFPHRIIRCVEGIEGSVPVEIVFRPTFDYAATLPRLSVRSQGAVAVGHDEALTLAVDVELKVQDDAIGGRVDVASGQTLFLSLTHGLPQESENAFHFRDEQAAEELDRTIRYWSGWAEQCGYRGPYRELVQRSALVLKLLVFEPTGGLVAAPTTGLWRPGEELDLAPLYRVDGAPARDEQELAHLEGYRGSRPVRIGNQAVNQRQADVFGHVIDAVTLCYERMPREMDDDLWSFLCELADHAAARWKEPDKGPCRDPRRTTSTPSSTAGSGSTASSASPNHADCRVTSLAGSRPATPFDGRFSTAVIGRSAGRS